MTKRTMQEATFLILTALAAGSQHGAARPGGWAGQMTDAADLGDLERGCRRWLRWFPTSFRREHEAEILGVLLAGARAGQRQPAPMERLDRRTAPGS